MKKLFLLFLSFLSINMVAQQDQGYQQPSKPILDLVDIELAPGVRMDEDKTYMMLTYRNQYKTIAELSEPEMRLGGLRINPKTNIGSRTNYINNLKMKRLNTKDDRVIQIEGLPENARLANFAYSPDQLKIACTNTIADGVELWLVDILNASARKLTDATINANTRDVINWFEDSKSMLVKMLPQERGTLIDVASAIPDGPTISVSDGKKAQNRTYQDLLQNKQDEHNFEVLATSTIAKVSIDGQVENWLEADMYTSISFSPDGSYVMVSKVGKPFSYLVPYRRFPSTSIIYDKDGNAVETVLDVPLIEDLPKGFMAARKGRRSMRWRADKPSSLVFAVALDGGDPNVEVEYRDELFELEAPFNGTPRSMFKTKNRFSGISWGHDNLAVAYDYWWNNRNTKMYTFDPSKTNQEAKVISDRNYQNVYSDPGNFVTHRNKYGNYVLALDGSNAMLIGDGYTKDGQFPFLDMMNLEKGTKKRMYQS
ncbi:MAG: S9 family peptidase, partial [Bacteroidia bacterium]|nr:S9 family peptidase [Bacteroidia bacterium]